MSEFLKETPLACAALADPDVGSGLKSIHLAPWGKIKATNGEMVLDEESVREITAKFKAHGASLPIDVEHETLAEFTPPHGSRGAVGWIESLYSEPGRGLFAMVKWSDAGRELIRGEAFRYLSPVFLLRRADRRVVALHSAALTNTPAIPQVMMERLAASAGAGGAGKTIADATVAATTAKAAKASDQDAEIAVCVRRALGLAENADAAETLMALSRMCVTAMNRKAVGDKAREVLTPYVAKGALEPNSKSDFQRQDYEECLALAELSPKLCRKMLDARMALWPPQGKLTMSGPVKIDSNRRSIITTACREYRGDPQHAKMTTLRAFANLALIEADQKVLHSDEISLLGE